MGEDIKRLSKIMDEVPTLIQNLDESFLSDKPNKNKWSKKEILGHLCDSAFNNIQRFIRVQYETDLKIVYDQDQWVKSNNYQGRSAKEICQLWQALNQQILQIWKNFPNTHLSHKIDTGKNKTELVTLEFLIRDYNDHLAYHLQQIINKKY